MKTTALLLCAALALSACSNRLGGGDGSLSDDGFGTGATGGIASGAAVPGSADDPTSVAHFQQRVGDRVLFAVDQSTLSPEARQTLDGQAAWLRSNPGFTALVEGHADEQGTREYNLALGGRRANAVRDYLVLQGVDATRLRTISYGKERPIQVCSQEACYAQNRRSVTVLAAGAGV